VGQRERKGDRRERGGGGRVRKDGAIVKTVKGNRATPSPYLSNALILDLRLHGLHILLHRFALVLVLGKVGWGRSYSGATTPRSERKREARPGLVGGEGQRTPPLAAAHAPPTAPTFNPNVLSSMIFALCLSSALLHSPMGGTADRGEWAGSGARDGRKRGIGLCGSSPT
jgi:hypothetical protein